MAEDSNSFRNDVGLSRWAINPTMAFKLSDTTKVVVSYEHVEDHRTADRGIPSFRPPGSVFGYPSPTDPSTFFGNPSAGFVQAQIDRAYARVEHTNNSGFTVRNTTWWAGYERMYQNVYAGGPLNLATGLVPLVAYNINNRENLFNQSDFIYKFDAGWTRHTLLAGAEFGIQNSDNFRRNGGFDSLGQCTALGLGNGLANGFAPASFRSPLPSIFLPVISFVTPPDQRTHRGRRSLLLHPGPDAGDALPGVHCRGEARDVRSGLRKSTSAHPGGARQSRPHRQARVAACGRVIVKPTDCFSIYGTWSVSYLRLGDRTRGVAAATVNLEPEKYINYK